MKNKTTADSRTEQIRVVRNTDLNGYGRLFGGQLLSWIDEVAAATARRHCGSQVTTVAIDNLHFKEGAYLNDIIVIVGHITFVGRTSCEVRVDTYIENTDGSRHPINRAYFCMVCMGDDGKPTTVPPLTLTSPEEEMEWQAAEKRRDLRLLRRKEGY